MDTINNYFDRVYVLNLDRRPDKMKRMERRLASVGITAERWSAVDGNSSTVSGAFDIYNDLPFNRYEQLLLGRKAIQNAGAMGCLLSYIQIVKFAKEEGYKRILCLEDDAIFHRNFDYRWSRFSKELPEDWKLLYLGASQLDWSKVSRFNDHFYHPAQTDGTFAFGIDHSVFDLFLQHAQRCELPVDTYLQTAIQNRYPKDCFVFKENLVIAELGNSDIRDEKLQHDVLRWDTTKYDHRRGGINVAMGVLTYNRHEYLQKFLRTFDRTKNNGYDWTLIIADDGSDDERITNHLALLESRACKNDFELIIIKNNRKGVAWQTNTILQELSRMDFDFAFIANDDIWFKDKGWDDAYIDHAFHWGFHHLVYHNIEWKPGSHCLGYSENANNKKELVSYVNAYDSLGCLFTITPEILRKVGYFDYQIFGFRGGEHIDFTVRCCRAGYNQEENLWDVPGMQELVIMHQREGYKQSLPRKEIEQYLRPAVMQRKERVIRNEKRLYIEFNNSVEKIQKVERGIVLGALGHAIYGSLAVNMAMSIKAADKYMPVALFYSEDAVDDLTHPRLQRFDHVEEMEPEYYTLGDNRRYQMAKTYVYNLSPYEITIYFDADSLWNPFRQPGWLFDHLARWDFTIDCNGFLHLLTEQRTRKNYVYWVKNDKWGAIKRYYDVKQGVAVRRSRACRVPMLRHIAGPTTDE